ncbi:hypothetical protein ABZ470_26550 [Streptosporangium sp. NPDC020072]|uniref:hypothetical protein n=1 Tax=Streptosporangium sp. NPDC020072 TaxID=3154788 RepID=UPI0034134EE0
MSIGILSWEDPAPRATTKIDYAPIAASLRDRPDQWAVVAENPLTTEGRRETSRMVNAIKRCGAIAPGTGTYKAVTRTVTGNDGEKVLRVYATYTSNS